MAKYLTQWIVEELDENGEIVDVMIYDENMAAALAYTALDIERDEHDDDVAPTYSVALRRARVDEFGNVNDSWTYAYVGVDSIEDFDDGTKVPASAKRAVERYLASL